MCRKDLSHLTGPRHHFYLVNLILTTAYAHSLPGKEPAHWEPLEHHLEAVARLAGENAAAFGAEEWGRALGRWHDLGKYSLEFQQYLLRTADPDAGERSGRVDHSTFGAQYAAKAVANRAGRILAFCIAGHHAGLADATSDDEATRRSTLEARLVEGPPRVPQVQLPPNETLPPELTLPFRLSPENRGFQVAFFTRLLFSCLVDADRTATELFCDPAQAAERNYKKPTIGELQEAVHDFLHRLESESIGTPVNRLRAEVRANCVAAAQLAPGFFSLTVPTGGGKTLSSLAFALHHASTHQLRRVVFAVPFTTIIEQTADAYRRALGAALAEAALLEHHTNIAPKRDTRRNQLATENWDSPLVVTTNVQLYESLFAAATTPCRKLHRLARSVIVLDEAQTLPVEVLEPTLLALKELVVHYGCTVVLCTATQPPLGKREEFRIGIEGVREIIDDAKSLFTRLNRVQLRTLGHVPDEALAERLAAERAALCVVNSRRHAATVYDALARLQNNGSFHLSTFMCAQHRRHVLAEIRQRLAEGLECRVVSTQLIEAGVDLDFPVVYRAPAGFDSIAQAAGRCNREGLLERGTVHLFDTPTPPPPGFLRNAAQTARELETRYADPLTPEAIRAYFELFYWSQSHRWDDKDVLSAFADNLHDKTLRLKFRTAASDYRIIRDDQEQVLAPYDSAARRMRDDLRRGEPITYRLLRAAQRYIVPVYRHDLASLLSHGVVEEHEESGLFLLLNDAAYSRAKGLSLTEFGTDADLLIA